MFSTVLYFLFLCCAYAHQYITPDSLCDLIDLKIIKYNFQCGDVFCEGPIQYCSDDNVCLYCSKDVCQTQTPPGQCQLQCKSLQFRNIKEECEKNLYQMSNSTEDYERDTHGFCVGIPHLSAGFAVMLVLLIIIFTAMQLCKRCRNRKNAAFVNVKYCCFSYPDYRKQNATCTSEEMTSICVPSGK